MFLFFKTPPGAPADSRLKTVALYLIFAGLVLLVVFEVSIGFWGLLYYPLSGRWFVASVLAIWAGCVGLMVDDVRRMLKKMREKYGKNRHGRGRK
ncbi:hypothetical protein GE278_24240 (plasmid) [Enterobacteriaceae bacterium Kacie_13]|nr:hypothetical protein GE278_24240 [Enterobacteriaceae bacterium Kacie_13]